MTAENRSGYVYLLKAHKPFEECYKIGRTKDPKQRFRDFGVRLPYEVEVLCVGKVEDCHQAEAYLHNFFAGRRLGGEWFSLDANDVDLIRATMLTHEALCLVRRLDALIERQTDENWVAWLKWRRRRANARYGRRWAHHQAIVYRIMYEGAADTRAGLAKELSMTAPATRDG